MFNGFTLHITTAENSSDLFEVKDKSCWLQVTGYIVQWLLFGILKCIYFKIEQGYVNL